MTPADPFDMGAGHVDPSTAGKGSIFEPGLAYDAGLFEYAAFTCGAELGVFNRRYVWFPGLARRAERPPADLNLPSIGRSMASRVWSGDRGPRHRDENKVAKEQGWRTYNVSVDAPEGFDVTVTPSTMSVCKPGMTASYEVTVSNVSSPIGEWRHGSLTWSDKTGHYTVYSPISVNYGARRYSPTGSKGAGSTAPPPASTSVSFGYTGDYSAAGARPRTRHGHLRHRGAGPGQNFDPNDGYSNPYTFETSRFRHSCGWRST